MGFILAWVPFANEIGSRSDVSFACMVAGR